MKSIVANDPSTHIPKEETMFTQRYQVPLGNGDLGGWAAEENMADGWNQPEEHPGWTTDAQ